MTFLENYFLQWWRERWILFTITTFSVQRRGRKCSFRIIQTTNNEVTFELQKNLHIYARNNVLCKPLYIRTASD